MHRRSTGRGAVYQGRYKALPMEDDRHFLAVCRYVERNALRAKLVHRAEEWRWSSAGQHVGNHDYVALAEWPVPRPAEWLLELNNPESTAEVEVAERKQARRRNIGRPLSR
jgi:putative transposase